MTTLAYILRLRGKYPEAVPLYEKALAYLETLPNVNQRELASNINSLAILYRLSTSLPLLHQWRWRLHVNPRVRLLRSLPPCWVSPRANFVF